MNFTDKHSNILKILLHSHVAGPSADADQALLELRVRRAAVVRATRLRVWPRMRTAAETEHFRAETGSSRGQEAARRPCALWSSLRGSSRSLCYCDMLHKILCKLCESCIFSQLSMITIYNYPQIN